MPSIAFGRFVPVLVSGALAAQSVKLDQPFPLPRREARAEPAAALPRAERRLRARPGHPARGFPCRFARGGRELVLGAELTPASPLEL